MPHLRSLRGAVLAAGLLAIIGFRFHVGDFAQGALKLLPAEKPSSRLDWLAVSESASEKGRHKLLHRDVVSRGQFGGPVVQILGNGDALAHIPSPLIVLKNSPGVITRIPNLSTRGKCLVLWVTIASARPATASSRRNSSPGSGRTGFKLK